MIRIGIDFGGTKIEAAALDADGRFVSRIRQPNPGGYDAALRTVRDLVLAVEAEVGAALSIGVGHPGSISPKTGLIRNANSTWMNGRAFGQDLEGMLGRPVRLANDANCLALSEATDGAGAGHGVVFAAVLGTGCGGGVVIDGQVLNGKNGVAGEWGHTPLPWASADERDIAPCWCGRQGCLETWISGGGLRADYRRRAGQDLSGADIVAAARAGEGAAKAALDAYIDRLGRALSVVVDILDPDAIVFGGGMSNTPELYDRAPDAVRAYAFTDSFETPILPALHGDSSGVRGAAWLWPVG